MLEADVVVTATGLNMLPMGGITLTVDGADVELPETTIYKSMMLSDVPNFAFAIGYTNASWTLKVDLVCEHLCRLLASMDVRNADMVVPVRTGGEMERLPLFDLTSGYVQRGIRRFPHVGTRGPWTAEMAYERDVARLRDGAVDDPELRFRRRVAPSARRRRLTRTRRPRPQPSSYSSRRRNHGPVSLRPSGARSSHGYIPQIASSAAGVGRVGVVHDAVLEREGAHPRRLARVRRHVGPGHGRDLGDERVALGLGGGHGVVGPVVVLEGSLALALLGDRHAEVEVEVAAERGHPREPPPHPALVGADGGDGARDTAANATSWCSRWTTEPSKPSAIVEQTGHAPVYSGPNMRW